MLPPTVLMKEYWCYPKYRNIFAEIGTKVAFIGLDLTYTEVDDDTPAEEQERLTKIYIVPLKLVATLFIPPLLYPHTQLVT